MKTTIIAVRHGYSKTNVTNTFAGSLDAPLTEQGILQAKLAAEFLKKYKIDKIYSSDLCRAYETAKPIAQALNADIEKNKNLREIFAGDWEGKNYMEIAEIYPEQYNLWINDIGNCTPENGESVRSFFVRIKNAVFEIAKNNEGKTICITTHATPIRVLKAITMGKNVDELGDTPWCANASISFFEFENDTLSLVNYGLTDHLGNNVTTIPNCI